MKSIFVVSLVALLVSACANPINLKTASQYAEGCRGFQAQNEWWKARRACGRAAINFKLGGAQDQVIAFHLYEYGRTSGAICDYVEAQRGFDEAMKLDQGTGRPIYLMSLLAMTRLSSAQEKFAEAVGHYEKFWLETSKAFGEKADSKALAEKTDPIAIAEIYEEQADIYRHVGNSALSKAHKDRAQELRAANPNKNKTSTDIDYIPYGKFCDQKS